MYQQWQRDMILADACERLHNHSLQTVPECFSKKFKCYKMWPKDSKFKKPSNVPEDANWASMHINGKICFGGHMVDNIFYIVFLDENHGFWPCDKK